jgi:NAD-dependent DNA ligase
VGEKTALALYEQGFGSADEILAAAPEELAAVPGIGPKTAVKLQKKVAARLAELAEKGLEPPKPDDYLEPEFSDTAEEEGAEEAEEAEAPAEEVSETAEEAPPEEKPSEGDEEAAAGGAPAEEKQSEEEGEVSKQG